MDLMLPNLQTNMSNLRKASTSLHLSPVRFEAALGTLRHCSQGTSTDTNSRPTGSCICLAHMTCLPCRKHTAPRARLDPGQGTGAPRASGPITLPREQQEWLCLCARPSCNSSFRSRRTPGRRSFQAGQQSCGWTALRVAWIYSRCTCTLAARRRPGHK